MNKLISLAVLSAAGLAAQQFHEMIQFDKLAPKASKTVEVNLDGNMLSFVRNFLSDDKKDEAEAKRIIGKLKGIYVRSLEFDKDDQYNEADIEALRKQFSGPGWQKMVDVREKGKRGDNAGVYIKTDGKEMSGLVVLSFEPREVTIVNLVGVIDPSELRALSGKAGLNLGLGALGGLDGKNKANKKDEDE
jgi:hypothetical protein